MPRKHQTRQTHKGTAPPKAAAGYSKNTVRLIKAALSTVLSDAVDDGYVPTNPAFGAGRKRGRRAETLTASERLQKITPLSWEDRDVLLTAAASSRRYHAFAANQLRLLLSIAAYVLFQTLQSLARGMGLGIVLHLPQAFPWRDPWRDLAQALTAT